jgi:hypothetical protein
MEEAVGGKDAISTAALLDLLRVPACFKTRSLHALQHAPMPNGPLMPMNSTYSPTQSN